MTQLQTDVNKLEELYTFKDREEVLNFLTPALVEVLLEAPTHIHQFFPDAPLVLELVIDAEDSNWVELFLLIVHHFAVEDAIEQLNKLRDAWFFDKPYEGVRENLVIGLGYLDEF